MLIALLIAAAAVVPDPRAAAFQKRFFPLGFPVDDGYLEGEFQDNPARLDARIRYQRRRVAVVGRVSAITHPGAGGYLVMLAPRRSNFAIECETRGGSQLASLHRGGLAIVSGTATAVVGRRLRLLRCRVEYGFQDDAKVIGASYTLCLGEAAQASCIDAKGRCAKDDGYAKLTGVMKAARASVGAKAIRCSNPIFALLRACELAEDDEARKLVQLSCSGRHEIVDARNEVISDEEGHTQREIGTAFSVEREPRSRLLDEMIKSGQTQDEER